MTPQRPWSRRQFLRVTVGSSAALVAGGFVVGLPATDGYPTAGRVVSLLPSRESAVAVGRAYLASAPSDVNGESLLSALVATVSGVDGTPRMVSDQELRERIDAAIRTDFALGDTVRLHGWLLSVTEARLCALVALDEGSSMTDRG